MRRFTVRPALGSLRRGRASQRSGAATLLLLAFGAPTSAEKLQLAIQTTPGDTLVYRMQTQQELNLQGMTISVTEAGNVQLVAQESRQDSLQFAVRFSGFEGSVKRGDELMERKPQYEGITLRAAVSRRGEVLDVVPQTALPSEARDGLKSLLENFFAYVVEKPVEPGDTWTQTQQIPNKEDASAGPQVDTTTEYTLDEVTKKDGKKVAKILGKGRGKVNLQSSMGAVTGDVHGESTTWVGIDDGLILEMKSSSDFAGSLGTNKGSRAESLELKRVR